MTTLVHTAHRPLLPILLALSGAHLLNDLISSMIPAMYPLVKEAYALDFTQVGLINTSPVVLVARSGLPPDTLRELVDYLRANEKNVTEADAGVRRDFLRKIGYKR